MVIALWCLTIAFVGGIFIVLICQDAVCYSLENITKQINSVKKRVDNLAHTATTNYETLSADLNHLTRRVDELHEALDGIFKRPERNQAITGSE